MSNVWVKCSDRLPIGVAGKPQQIATKWHSETGNIQMRAVTVWQFLDAIKIMVDLSKVEWLDENIEPVESDIENAAEKLFPYNPLMPELNCIFDAQRSFFKAGASWQRESSNIEAILFNHWVRNERYYWDEKIKKYVAAWNNYSEHTTKELYNIYLDHLKSK